MELPVVSAPVIDASGLRDWLVRHLEGEVRFDRVSRALYSTDASVYQIVPVGVVVPKTEADVRATVEGCTRFGVPITARGGGTSQAGQAIGPGIVLDFSKYLHRIVAIDPDQRRVRAQPGCVLDDLNDAGKPHGLQFAPDISTSNRATIGGMVANNSSGTHSVIHGKTIDHVIGLKVLLADGSAIDVGPLSEAGVDAKCGQQNLEGACYRAVRKLARDHAAQIESRYPKILRRVGGYNLDCFVNGTQPFNLAKLLVGSEGTLGIVLEATLRLIELPKAKIVGVLHFADLLDALAATPQILTHSPAAVEVIDRYILGSTKLNPEASRLRDFLHGDPGAILIVEFYGERPDDLPRRLDDLERDLKSRSVACSMHRAAEAAAQARIWKLRKLALGLSMAEKGDAKSLSFVEDSAVAPAHLRDYIAEFLDLVARHGTKAGVYAHASVGCLHVRPVVNLKTEAGVRRFESIANEVSDLVLKYGGALSGEHGDGLVRSPFQEKMFGPVLYSAFREIKRTFDPRGIFNPGKIVDAPPLISNLRYGPAYVTPDVPTTFDFSADGGIVQAAELCAGVGECRKKRDGIMCPSFQATREEQHSTRGRANMLRLAMTGQMGLQGLTDPDLMPVLDLCLECKACKAECPTNVDMARLKAEFLHQYYKKHGLPWRNWIFGNVDRLMFWLGLTKWLWRSRLGRWLNDTFLGIDRRRLPPTPRLSSEFTWQLVTRKDYWLPPGVHETGDLWFDQWEQAQGFPDDPRPRVLIFPDTFTNWYEPDIGLAAVDLLRRLGLRVATVVPERFRRTLTRPAEQPVGMRCCGRPMISNGLLDRAVAHAQYNVDSLYPWAESGKPITACEPSCLLTIKDDYPALLRGEGRRKAEVVAAACRTFEEVALVYVSRSRNPGNDAISSQGMLRARNVNHGPVVVQSEEKKPGFSEETGFLGPKCTITRGPRRLLVQAHCHQRSLVGVLPLVNLLRQIPGAEVIDLDAGCCGMAGSFGYEKEHYEVSRLVGEQRLFPAIRRADADTVIVAPGFSCRSQIAHFTGRRALHPAELLAKLLLPSAPRR